MRAVRAARNQALFRQVNERVKEVNEPFAETLVAPDWVCECADPACIEKITLTMEDYEALRDDATHFAVAPDESHVFFEVEKVVARTDRYWIVEKIGTAGAVATADESNERAREDSNLRPAD